MFLSAFPIGTPYECRCRLGRRQCLAMRSASSSFEGLQISRSSPIATSWAEADFVMILSSCVRFAFRDLPERRSRNSRRLVDQQQLFVVGRLPVARRCFIAARKPAGRPRSRRCCRPAAVCRPLVRLARDFQSREMCLEMSGFWIPADLNLQRV